MVAELTYTIPRLEAARCLQTHRMPTAFRMFETFNPFGPVVQCPLSHVRCPTSTCTVTVHNARVRFVLCVTVSRLRLSLKATAYSNLASCLALMQPLSWPISRVTLSFILADIHHVRRQSAPGTSLNDRGVLRKPGYLRTGALLPQHTPRLEQHSCKASEIVAAMEHHRLGRQQEAFPRAGIEARRRPEAYLLYRDALF